MICTIAILLLYLCRLTIEFGGKNVIKILKMKQLFFILLIAICPIMVIAQTLEVPFVDYAPSSDGVIDEWSDSDFIEISKALGSTNGTKAQFQLSHDDNNLYVVVRVQDNTPANSPQTWNTYDRDCIEIYISMDNLGVSTSFKAGCWQLRIQRNGDIDGNSHRNTWSVGQLVHNENFSYGALNEKDEWAMEATLPYNVLSEGVSSFGKKSLSFEVRVADNTTDSVGGMTQELFWMNASKTLWSNPNEFTVVNLAPKKIVVGIIDLQNSSKSFAFVKNNFLEVRNLVGLCKVYDLSGRIVTSSYIEQLGSIDVSGLKSGMYILRSKLWSQKIALSNNY
jgi:hypothetical protein